MNGDVRRPVGAAAKVALIAGALAISLALQSLSAARAAATTGMCSSGSSPGEANRLSSDIGRAVGSRHGAVAVAFADLDSGVACALRSRDRFDSASVIKATILATLLFQAKARCTRSGPTFLAQTVSRFGSG